jgi:hypothetical protein
MPRLVTTVMALDIHLADEGDERFTDWPLCQFDMAVHEAIFFRQRFAIERYPMLLLMGHYYADARYSGDDLGRLMLELSEILPKFSGQPNVHGALMCLQNVCREAVLQKKVVHCVCD